MLKNSEILRYSTPRTHRTYTAQFKAELVAACQQPWVSIAALAGQHAINANVLHRWLKEHHRSGRRQLAAHGELEEAQIEGLAHKPHLVPQYSSFVGLNNLHWIPM